MRLTFYGGVGEVSGANYLLESGPSTGSQPSPSSSAEATASKEATAGTAGQAASASSGQVTKILIDCGLFQGSNFSEKQNWKPFPFDPKEISAVFITHAHIDHTGRLPKLFKEGFQGKIYSTPPTRDFANFLLLDSEHILLEEAERLKLPPLYGAREVEKLMTQWEGVPYHQEIIVGPIKATLYSAGHILGSSIVKIEVEGRKILFTGDLGNSPAPIIGAYEEFGDEQIDYCVVESAYGDRLHESVKEGIIEDVIEETVRAGGVLLIPAFAMERTQKLLFEINKLMEKGRIPPVPVYLDSPLAIKITAVYQKYLSYFDIETLHLMSQDKFLFDFPGLKKTLTTEESKAINNVPPPKIIIAGSGMSQGGRILHHEKRYLPDPKSAILFIGYQAKGSLGRKILGGEQMVKIHGEDILVRCRRLAIEGWSAHADQQQLLNWLSPMRMSLKKVFAVQGEEKASSVFVKRVINDLAIRAETPEKGKSYEL